MSILGLTIDYGPYGFLDRYDPDYIFNGSGTITFAIQLVFDSQILNNFFHSDTAGRYTYRNQPDICEWNLKKLAEALNPIMKTETLFLIIEQNYKQEYKAFYLEKMRKKVFFFRLLSKHL